MFGFYVIKRYEMQKLQTYICFTHAVYTSVKMVAYLRK